jgi:hypothetical protein
MEIDLRTGTIHNSLEEYFNKHIRGIRTFRLFENGIIYPPESHNANDIDEDDYIPCMKSNKY